jgi:hypothetical protein
VIELSWRVDELPDLRALLAAAAAEDDHRID